MLISFLTCEIDSDEATGEMIKIIVALLGIADKEVRIDLFH